MKSCNNRPWRRGFTLLEMAVSLVIIGFTVGMIVQSQQATQPTNCYAITQAQLNNIRSAINAYVRKYGRLPMPASRIYGVTNPNFGREISPSAIGDIDTDGTNTLYSGALPFQPLGLGTSFAVDCWGNKFTYVVTAALTTSLGMQNQQGAITINSVTNSLLAPGSDKIAYAVISHGETGGTTDNGGVTRNYSGANHRWCSTTTPTDHHNCYLASGNPWTLTSATFNNGSNTANFFDDLIIYSGKAHSNCNKSSYDASDGIVWTLNGATCTGVITQVPMGNGTTTTPILNSNTPAHTGSAAFKCDDGVFIVQPGFYCQ